ncbi:MAG: TIM barrel protein [Chloroflexi bacterium]|nr:TIM barrel protein [Chloroflexota bacterium]MCI0774236.1 TIM barrel protein [Chloroflexota bacterium]MCI0803429.1 TIM barrel protein [Chloroflexota bacterium]MCI0808235.1 TIM barrel protein [Chloroflexota bacterium]MCI0833295.1 TIM barrel protein [Chloroflexota bacterium]
MHPIYLQALSFHDLFGTGEAKEECVHAAADMATELGIAGIDIEDRLLKSFEPRYLQELAHQVEGRGIQFGYCGLIVDFRAPVSSIEDEIDRAKKLIDAVPHLGITSIRVPGNGVVGDQTVESTWAAVRDKFGQICEYAGQAGVTVFLHNHNHGSTPSTGAEVTRMLDEIDNDALSYVLDTGQFQGSPGAGGRVSSPDGSASPESSASPELYESIETCAHRAKIVRAKFYFAVPGNEQWLDYPRIVRILKNAAFSGPISIVYEPRGDVPSTEALPAAVRYLTDLFDT